MGLEGLVSKHRERAYWGDHWIKVKAAQPQCFPCASGEVLSKG
jgi:ATP-dependent DNA ligase